MAAKEAQRDAGDITARSYADYFATCKRLFVAFGVDRFVDDLAADDFEGLRKLLAGSYGVHRLGNEVQRTRVLFKYGFDAGLIDKPMRYSPTFKKPSARIMRAARQNAGPKMFAPAQLRSLIDTADQPLKAMVLLAINYGFGNHDCGTLPMSAVDLNRGWVTFPRPKTAIERRCLLWPETLVVHRHYWQGHRQARAERAIAGRARDEIRQQKGLSEHFTGLFLGVDNRDS